MAAVVAYAVVTAPPKRLVLPPVASRTVAFGAYHVHTTRSDGAFTPDEVANAARQANLSFVILTDHGDASRPPDAPRYVNGVLVIDAVEVSVVEGHVVALGLAGAAPYRLGGEARDVIEDIHRLGGFAIVAHPDSPRPDLRWRPPAASAGSRNQIADLSGADGMEWLNADNEWRDERPLRIFQTLINFPVRPAESLARLMSRPTAALRRWDALTRRRPAIGLGATDAHGFAGRFYAQTLASLSQAVEMRAPWSGAPAGDAALVLDALRAGRAWTMVSAFAGPAVARLAAKAGAESAVMGGSLTATTEPVEITATIEGAAHARVAIWHNDREIASGMGDVRYQGPAEVGAYRAEASLAGFSMPWIVTNPVYIAAPPPIATAVPAAKPQPDDLLIPLTPGGDWAIEHGPTSDGSVAMDPGGGVRFGFRVGTVRPGLEYSALARSMGETAESFDRVEFTGSSSAPMRVLVQFRLPGGSDGERWSRSVYLDTTPRPITVRMTDVTPVGFQATRRPVVARVKSILFVLDTLNTAPGTSGEILLKNVRLARSRPVSGPNGEEQVRRPGQK
ncbi:MAG: hypothetical protein EPO35_11770 [Acidobacteria bacterium]|nr:MAG: hypothetical protein EPO35_11770 [Acidobacteriota bacterium]